MQSSVQGGGKGRGREKGEKKKKTGKGRQMTFEIAEWLGM